MQLGEQHRCALFSSLTSNNHIQINARQAGTMVTKEFSDNALQSVPNNSVAGLFTGGYPKPRMCAIVLLPDNKKRPSGDHSGTIGQS
jgi:hypothetical protein